MDTNKRELAKIVGDNYVIDDPDLLDRYSRDESFAEALRPRFVVRPGKASEVQELVQWANGTHTPLIPVSSGFPHSQGDTVPTAAEAVIVDLSRLKAIIRIDTRNRIAIVEPGVTYAELVPALAEEGLRLPLPLMPRANKSVVASLIERQPTTIPRLNFSLPEPLRTLGVVWGTGELAFTGEAGGGPLSLEEQWKRGLAQIEPKGPAFTDLHRLITGAQGSMGIAIWASVKLEFIPAARKVFYVPSRDLGSLVDLVYKLTKIRVGDELFIVNRTRLAGLAESDPVARGKLRDQLPDWVLVVALGGTAFYPEEKVQVQEHKLAAAAQEFRLSLLEGLPGITQKQMYALLDGCGGAPETCRDIFFLATLDRAAGYVDLVEEIAAHNDYPATKIGIYVQPQHQGVSNHVEFRLPFDPANEWEAAKVRNIYYEASDELIAQGAYFSRPYGYWSELIYQRDTTSTELLRIAKNIVDPENVMNPGKLCF